jgi:hypothetical protein
MSEWWPAIGEASIAIGSGLGLTWAVISTLLRRRRFSRSALVPVAQLRWFMLNFLGMGSYLTLVIALGLASLHGLLPAPLLWFLLVLSAAAFGTALIFPATPMQRSPARRPATQEEPPADPPLLPVRKSA